MRNLQQYPFKQWELNEVLEVKGRYIHNKISNMMRVDIEGKDGVIYPSVENFYQAHKSKDIQIRKYIACLTPHQSKKEGRRIPQDNPDWNDGLDVMYEALYTKWNKNEWKNILLSLPEVIVEWNNWKDNKWGVAIEIPPKKSIYSGRNILGCMLMDIRQKILNHQ